MNVTLAAVCLAFVTSRSGNETSRGSSLAVPPAESGISSATIASSATGSSLVFSSGDWTFCRDPTTENRAIDPFVEGDASIRPHLDVAVKSGQMSAWDAVVLGYRFWQSYYGSDPNVVDRTIRLIRTLRA
jgi:hypothetical protein